MQVAIRVYNRKDSIDNLNSKLKEGYVVKHVTYLNEDNVTYSAILYILELE